MSESGWLIEELPLTPALSLKGRGSKRRTQAFSSESRGSKASGFTLVEMLTTVAVLVVLLGLMVSLARDVRNRSANELTSEILTKLDYLMADYVKSNGGQLPVVTPLIAAGVPTEDTIRATAWQNNADVVNVLRRAITLQRDFGELPGSMYDEAHMRDAWGNPIVFMAAMHNEIGMAPGDTSFFFSAGPDRRYLSREDNLYSYERTRAVREQSDLKNKQQGK